jgi:hypothetical protein
MASQETREQHLRQVKELIKTFADPCDGKIYHYTSAEGFRNIIESGEIWLTNTEFVNDTLECSALREEEDLFEIDELSFNRYIEKWWKRFSRDKSKNNNYYITSFSKEPDSLEQWRAYGNICICFDAQRFIKNGFSLYECVYSKEEIKRWIIEKAKANEWRLDEPDRTRNYIADNGIPTTSYDDGRDGAAFHLIFNASIKLKHFCYSNEKEVRLLTVSDHDWGLFDKHPFLFDNQPPIHFRIHPAYKIPVSYVKFFIPDKSEKQYYLIEDYEGKTEYQIKEERRETESKQKRAFLPIREISIGPRPHKEETKLACEIFLRERGYKDVPVRLSKIPYRGF